VGSENLERRRPLTPLVMVGAAATGVLLAALPPILGLGALAGTAAAVLVALADGWLTLYVAAQPLQGISLFGVEAFGFRLSHVFFLVALSLIVGRTLTRRSALPRIGLMDTLVAAFVAYTLLSISWSSALLSDSLVSGGKLLFDLGVFIGLSALVQNNPARTLRMAALGFAIGFLYMAGTSAYNLAHLGFKGLVARMVLEQSVSSSPSMRSLTSALTTYTGWAGHDTIAGWIAMGAFVVWGVLSGQMRRLRVTERVGWLLALAAAAAYVLVSMSRAAWLSLILTAPVVWWRTGHRIRVRWVAGLLGTVGVVVGIGVATGLWSVLVARVGVVSSGVDLAVWTRLETWRLVLAAFARHPLLGIGVRGSVALARSVEPTAGHAHNAFIQILGELGLVGAVLFVWMGGYILWRLWHAGNTLPPPYRRAAWGLFAAVVCYLGQSLTQGEFNDLGIWTVLGLAAGLIHLSPEPGAARPPG
jgi:O-antigen ligase